MRLSVIIPAYNEEKLLPATLAAVRAAGQAFDRRGWDWEMVVCDNNSSDRTAAVARAAGARVAFEPINQIGRARDTGARAAMGEWLVFIDADSLPDEALFAAIADALSSGRFVGGGATVRLPADSPWVARLFAGAWSFWSRLVGWAAGSCIWVEARAFRAIGGFGTEVYAGEEVWLSRRLGRLARTEGKRFVILHRHPLLTSDRKVRLYKLGDHLRLFFRMILTFGRAARRREDCDFWYDGRR
jgi:glycosyltransferase involved in cell wall biosynthesis